MNYPDDQLSFDMQHAHVLGRKIETFLELTTCLQKSFEVIWKSQVLYECFYPKVHPTTFQTKKNSLLALFLVPKPMLQSYSHANVEVPLPLVSI